MATFAPSHSDLEDALEHDGDLGAFTGLAPDRSETVSFELLTDISPQTAPFMEFNLSDGTSSEQSLAFAPAGFDLTLPMSQDFVDDTIFQQNYLLVSGAPHFFQGSSNGSCEQSRVVPEMSFGQATQSYPPQAMHPVRNRNQSDHGFQEQAWINGPQIKHEFFPEEDLTSPQTQTLQGSPWSTEGPSRYPGQALPHHQGWGLNTTSSTLNTTFPSYAASVLSSAHDSSPLGEGLRTPDSASRSPMFSNLALSSGATSSNGGDPHQQSFHNYDHTPRPLQTNFVQHHFLAHQDISPQSLLIDPSQVQQLHREPSHSPISDFVVIDRAEAVPATLEDDCQSSHSKHKKPGPRRSRVATTSKSRQEPDNFVSEYPSHATGPIRRQSSSAAKVAKDSGKRVGGRSLGMHLTEEAATRAKQLREEGSCWICCFQRDSCSPGPECDRCQKRHLRSQMEHGLGCDRTKLNDLRPYFIPDFLARSGDKRVLNEFMDNHIRSWDNRPVKVRVNIIWGQTPMELELYEFVPKTAELSRHLQSVLDKNSGKRTWLNRGSPPLAMVQIDNIDRRNYERFIDDIVNNPENLESFVERCYRFENDNFQRRLFRLMFDYQATSPSEKALWREIMRLQVITYIYCRASTVVNDDLPLLSSLQYAMSHQLQYGKSTTIRLANRQLKYLYTSLWKQIMESVLKRLQQVLRSSSGGSKWSSGFVAVLGLGMAFESIQLMAHAHQEADHLMGNATQWDGKERAERACRVIDEKFFFLTTLFRWKYHRGFNPFKNIHDREMHKTLGPNALELVQGVNELVTEKSEYLAYREQVAILSENKEKYTSRLVAKFLLGFWKPTSA